MNHPASNAFHINLTFEIDGEHNQCVHAAGCDEVQGYYFSTPVLFDDLLTIAPSILNTTSSSP